MKPAATRATIAGAGAMAIVTIVAGSDAIGIGTATDGTKDRESRRGVHRDDHVGDGERGAKRARG